MNDSTPQQEQRHWSLLVFFNNESSSHFDGFAHHIMQFRFKTEKAVQVKSIHSVFWIDFSAYEIGDDPAGYLIENAKVAFVPGVRFGEKFAGYVRLNFATSPEIITEAINRVAKALH